MEGGHPNNFRGLFQELIIEYHPNKYIIDDLSHIPLKKKGAFCFFKWSNKTINHLGKLTFGRFNMIGVEEDTATMMKGGQKGSEI